jgi:hypothetical protein
MIYNDAFNWLGAGKRERSQTNFMITAGQFSSLARKDETDLANCTFMLAPTTLVKLKGNDHLLCLHTPDILELA